MTPAMITNIFPRLITAIVMLKIRLAGCRCYADRGWELSAMGIFLLLAGGSLFAAACYPDAVAAKPSDHGIARKKEVLILNPYHPGHGWADDEQAGIVDVFREKDQPWIPVVEYLDLTHLPDGTHLSELKKFLRLKYRDRKCSVIIAMDYPGLGFAVDNRAELFGEVPVVFCGINNLIPESLKRQTDVTGIAGIVDLAGTIEVMLRLHPSTKEIFVPHDYTEGSVAVRRELEALVPGFGDKVGFRFTDPLTMEELLKEMERLPGDSLVLEIGFITDKSGRTFGMAEAGRLFFEHSPVPVYSIYEQRLGFGIAGGKLLRARVHGANAGRIALRVLAGEKASDIPVVFESNSRLMFDYKVMNRFGVPLSALPKGSTVINKPVSFYAAHRVVIQGASGIIVFFLIIMFLLRINIVQRRQAKETIRRGDELLKVITSNDPDLILIQDSDLRYSFITNPRLGLTVQDIIGKTDDDILSKKDAARLKAIKTQVLETGNPVHVETPLISRKGGREFFRGSYVPKFDAKGRVDGLIGYFRDLNERMRAESAIRSLSKLPGENPNPILRVGSDGIILFANTAGMLLLERFERQVGQLLPEEWIERIKAVFVGGRNVENEVECNGRIFSCTLAPIVKEGYVNIYGLDVTERKQAEEKLKNQSRRLRLLSARLSEVEEDERKRIARELHDQVGQNLTAIGINMTILESMIPSGSADEIRNRCRDSMVLLDKTSEFIRDLMSDIRSPVMDDFGLMAAIKYYGERFALRTGIAFDFHGSDIVPRPSKSVESTVFRIVQEALNNVGKHARAARVDITGEIHENTLRITIVDDGVGFDAKRTDRGDRRYGWGLMTMDERANLTGGNCSITSQPGRGVEVVVEVPI